MSRIKRLSRGSLLLGCAALVALGCATVALADNLAADGDGLTPVNDAPMAFGAVNCGQQNSRTAVLAVHRTGQPGGGNNNIFKNGATVTISVTATAGGVSASMGSPATVILPNDWESRPNGTMSDTVSSTVSITPSGSGSGSVSYRARGQNTDGTVIDRNTTLPVSWGNCSAPADTTPPSVTANVAGTPGDDGWYTSDVTVAWDVSDAQSAISSTTGCGPTTIDTDTNGTTLTCTATSAGGTSSKSVTIKRDASAPQIDVDVDGQQGSNSWYTGDVDVDWTVADGTSGIASSDGCDDTTVTTDTAGTTFTCSATNGAGLGDSKSVTIKRDATAPSLAVTGVSHGGSYTLGQAPAAGCDTTDAMSGVATAASLSSSGGPVGSVTDTCSGATDAAGNSANAASATYRITYDWTGFLRPIDNGGVFNQVKAGSAVPVKFKLGGDQGLGVLASGYPKSQVVSCAAAEDVSGDTPTVTAGASSLSYDATTGEYTYVWKTDKGFAGSCRQLVVILIDGSIHRANFKFVR